MSKSSYDLRKKRHQRVRKKVKGTAERPRMSVYRSNENIYAQLIDDKQGDSLVSVSTIARDLREKLAGKRRQEAAYELGKILADKARERGIKKVVFDRSGYRYHGVVKALAEGARKGGLDF